MTMKVLAGAVSERNFIVTFGAAAPPNAAPKPYRFRTNSARSTSPLIPS